jgi:hypothetical protein
LTIIENPAAQETSPPFIGSHYDWRLFANGRAEGLVFAKETRLTVGRTQLTSTFFGPFYALHDASRL